MTDCKHLDFKAEVDVNRLQAEEGGPVTNYSASVRIACADCGMQFEFAGFGVGMSMYEPLCNVDGTEVHLPIKEPGHTIPEGLPGYRIDAPLDH